MDAHKVLSFSPDREALLKREAALRKSGVEVFSTSTENQARFEIETGKCGVLLICFRVSPLQAKDLASLFRKNGYIIFVLNDTHDLGR